jgi:hypothetical protein
MNNGLNTRIIVPTLLAKKSYLSKILATSPLAYWPLNETSGEAAKNYGSGLNIDGTYIGVDLAQAAGPDGVRVPFFDGTNDYVALPNVQLNTIWPWGEGSMSIWIKMRQASDWDNVTFRFAMAVRQQGAAVYAYQFSKRNVANSWRWQVNTNNSDLIIYDDAAAWITWQHMLITWSVTNNRMRGYQNGVQVGADQAPVNAGTPTISADYARIGALQGVSYPWIGWLAHAAVWNKELTPAEVAALAVV